MCALFATDVFVIDRDVMHRGYDHMIITGNDIRISHCVHTIQYIHNCCSIGRLEQRKGNHIFINLFLVAMDFVPVIKCGCKPVCFLAPHQVNRMR